MTNKKHQKGIWIRSNKTFYYLESGALLLGLNHLERLKGTLISKGLIKSHSFERITERDIPYKYMTVGEAQEAEITIQPIFLSPNVKKAWQERKADSKDGLWSK